ncbi:CRAL/TRIO domain-containing protein [Lentithecium fluviatile CBS 122367]|uniref:CRAL/TRIO domain-containing protein n=1 Tax=Lentithecium fluviatile CBS 122367 TaxID=1168545 RepID=A0A6G1J531_9PLEO|nr:CRAL/TRIO domain-containing protein [Lentithecium fluviatile CBS 122367]
MAELKRVESFQYPSGHYAHLTENQQKSLDEFKQICQKDGYYTPAGDGRVHPSHDDETLLRFLRARRFVPQEAFKQFKDTEDWRKEHGIDDLFLTIEIEEFERTRRLYPQWLGRRDKRGIPVYLFEVAPLNSKNISSYEKELAKALTTSPKAATKNLRLFALYESLTRYVIPLCSALNRPHPETPISQSNNIVDISGVGLKQFWNLKGHMQDASTLATAHYPETLDRIFIVGAPAFFPTVWGWVKRWFDPITVSKIFILSPANVFSTLSQYIDPDNIPKKYGGNLDFEFGDMPNLEPAIQEAIKWELPSVHKGRNTFPIGPIKWEDGENGAKKAIAVGSEQGKLRNTHILTIPNPVGAKAEVPVVNTPVDELELQLLGDGTATQPPDTEIPNVEDQTPPPSDTPTPSATPKPESQATTSTTPATSSTPSVDGGAKETTLPIREGTSDTRYEQQHQTHASGQLADGTPHAAVNDHGHGDKTVTMEPGTVGQAPKDVSIKPQEPPAPGYLYQAKQVAAQASSVVTSTVGSAAGAVTNFVGGSGEKVEEKVLEKTPEQKELDKKIDGKDELAMESFLREQTATKVQA